MEKPLEMSRYCVPFTPFKKRLEDSRVCLVSTAGVRKKDDRPFVVEGDTTFRTIALPAAAEDLAVDDAHYDHACIDQDVNCVFPIDRLRALADEKRIGGLTDQHFAMGFSQNLKEVRDTTVPQIARAVAAARPDIVLLTGGWRLCHRTVVTVQRAIEMQGIPTVLITVEAEESAQARPPRALSPKGYVPGHSLGRPRDEALQKRIVMDALGLLLLEPRPGEVVSREYS